MKYRLRICVFILSVACIPIWLSTRADALAKSRSSLSSTAAAPQNLEFQFQPVKHLTGADTLGSITALNAAQGRIVYTTFGFEEPYPTALSLFELNAGIKQNGQQNGLQCDSFAVKKSNSRVLVDPLFSPDGRYVLLKFGTPWSSVPSYQLCVLDTRTQLVKVLSLNASYPLVSWSPDSKYIAFVQGGDFQGGTQAFDFYIGPLRLFICDWHTDKSFEVSANDTVRGPFSWIAPHTLVFGMLSPPSSKNNLQQPVKSKNTRNKKPTALSALVTTISRPDIYEFSPENGHAKRLIKDGYLPCVSPDGQWIAFFGSEHPDRPYPLQVGWENAAYQGTSLCVVRRDGTKRKALDRVNGFYPALCWRSNGHGLVTIQQVQFSPNAQAQVEEWDIRSGRRRSIASVQAKDFKQFPESIVDPNFR